MNKLFKYGQGIEIKRFGDFLYYLSTKQSGGTDLRYTKVMKKIRQALLLYCKLKDNKVDLPTSAKMFNSIKKNNGRHIKGT